MHHYLLLSAFREWADSTGGAADKSPVSLLLWNTEQNWDQSKWYTCC